MPIALGGEVEVILTGCKALGDSEQLSQGYLLFLWKILDFTLAWVPLL